MHTTPLPSHPEKAELCDAAEGDEAPESHAGPSDPSPCPYGALNSPLPAAAGTDTALEAVQELQLMAGCSSNLLWRGISFLTPEITARLSSTALTQHQHQHPAGSAQSPRETLTQQPGQGQDSPSCLLIYRASSQHQEYESFFFSSQAFHTRPISVPQPGHVCRKEKLELNKNRGF